MSVLAPMTTWKLKMAVSVALDFADLTIGVVPVAGHLGEVVSIPIAMLLWGWRGGLYGLEMLDITNVADGFIPTASMIGWSKKAEYEQLQLAWAA